MTLLWTVLSAVVAAALVMSVAALWARRLKRMMVVDAAWGAAFVVVALAAGSVAQLTGDGAVDGDAWRRWLLVGLVVVWGSRLTWHLVDRVRSSDHDDPRYEELLGGSFEEVGFGRVVRKVFGLQGVLVVVISAPVIAGVTEPTRAVWIVAVGVGAWVLGLTFEAVGDAQLAAYRRDPERPPILATGLWAWTRHPNYFGDAAVWWGLWLAGGAASGWLTALVTLPAPLAMTWFLTVVSGAKRTERRMEGRPGWAAYAARTPMFVPLPPALMRHR